MKIRQVEISNYRGIGNMKWSPQSDLACIIGAGDVGKSTILDAIEATLSPRRTQFFDTDFPSGDTSHSIEIKITIGELPEALCDDSRMGLFLRGCSETGELHDEPSDNDEDVVTVRLTVDLALEPIWELITDRSHNRTLSSSDRVHFGLVRLGEETDGAFSWGQYSPLTRMSADRTGAGNVLTDAYRQAREAISASPMPNLTATAAQVRAAAIKMGAYSEGDYLPGLDTQRSSTSLATLSLHNLNVPLRLKGLGTRRLTSLAIQRIAVPEGAIVLIDELEHGLEPHRIRHALQALQKPIVAGESTMTGQVILTTHSSITIEELGSKGLSVASRTTTTLNLKVPDASLEAMIRKNSQALLSRSILVCEGKTEIGLFRGLRTWWTSRHDNESIECRGISLANGEGSSGVVTALNLHGLGYRVALFRDSDIALSVAEAAQLTTAGIPVIEWVGSQSTEEAFLSLAPDDTVQSLLEIGYRERGLESAKTAIAKELGVGTVLSDNYLTWITPAVTAEAARSAIAKVSKNQKWYKRVNVGEEFGQIIQSALAAGWTSRTVTILERVEAWLYGN